jgi:hypothetical protein
MSLPWLRPCQLKLPHLGDSGKKNLINFRSLFRWFLDSAFDLGQALHSSDRLNTQLNTGRLYTGSWAGTLMNSEVRFIIREKSSINASRPCT